MAVELAPRAETHKDLEDRSGRCNGNVTNGDQHCSAAFGRDREREEVEVFQSDVSRDMRMEAAYYSDEKPRCSTGKRGAVASVGYSYSEVVAH